MKLCKHCNKQIGKFKRVDAVYCGETCRTKVANRRYYRKVSRGKEGKD